MKYITVGLTLFLLVTLAWAGTYQNDFEIERDFLDDKQNGVWKVHPNAFTWEGGVIRGVGPNKLLMFGEPNWTDYTLQVKVQLQANSSGGMGLRFNNGPHYSFWFDESANLVGISTRAFPRLDILVEKSFNLEPDTWYSLKGVAEGKKLEFYIGEQLVVETENDRFSSGMAGVCTLQGVILFDDFLLQGPDVPDGGRGTVVAVEPQAKLATIWAKIKNSR